MRVPVIAISIWMFISMTVLGVVGYAYVLWSQYWRTALERQQSMNLRSSKYKRDSSLYPSFLSAHPGAFHMSTGDLALHSGHHNFSDVPMDKLLNKINTYKNQLMIQLRKAQLVAGNVIFHKEKGSMNHYKVSFKGRKTLNQRSAKQLTCQLKKSVKIVTLGNDLEPFRKLGYGKFFPEKSIFEALGMFNTCAIVSSAGSMYKSKLGKEIDLHDAVLRYNSAPTEGYEVDVGSKTTIRVLNSQVVSKPEFEFFHSRMYRNITLIVWDPSRYHGTLDEWYTKPDFDLFTPYWLRREILPKESFYILHPDVGWNAWDFIQKNTAVPVEQNPPSSGFLGMLLMMSMCNTVDVYEYVPSMRLTKRCHYFDVHDDIGCTFGDWHPLASEKLMALSLNIAHDFDIFLTGKITLMGFRNLKC